MVTRRADFICASRGPRIDDTTPLCYRPLGHAGSLHWPHPDQGWGNLCWGAPPMQDPNARATVYRLGLRPYIRRGKDTA